MSSDALSCASGLLLPLVPQTLDTSCGAACFESMFRYFRASAPGEMHFAKELGTLEYGYTPPESILSLARTYGFTAEMWEGSEFSELQRSFRSDSVLFVTWWDEDAGHYSLVQNLEEQSITLMDPWAARDGRWNRMATEVFIPYWKMRGSRVICITSSRTLAKTDY